MPVKLAIAHTHVWVRKDIRFEQIAQTVSRTAPSVGHRRKEIHQRRKHLGFAICQQSRRLDMVHLSDLMVQLDEADEGVFWREGVESIFHYGRGIGLHIYQHTQTEVDRLVGTSRERRRHTSGS